MSRILIIKTGAAGDVLRTTPLLRALKGEQITWLVSEANRPLLPYSGLEVVTDPDALKGRVFDFVFSLEDDYDLLTTMQGGVRNEFGADWRGYYIGPDQHMHSVSLCHWYEMGLHSPYGLQDANRLKIASRKSYQQHIFDGLGVPWNQERYVMPMQYVMPGSLGDIAFAVDCGPRWPSRRWVYFGEAIEHFRQLGYVCNVLPRRQHILGHVADVRAHRVLVSGVSLPMHIGIGLGMPTVALFTCINPDEIESYGALHKVVSPRWQEFFMTREVVPECMSAIPLDQGIAAIEEALLLAEKESNKKGLDKPGGTFLQSPLMEEDYGR